MSKKLIFGLLMICVVAALVAVGTFALFSDIEVSEDNTFVAGSLDLKVNGMDDPTVETFFDVECVAPGDMGSADIHLENVGCCVDANADIMIMNLVDNENTIMEPEDDLGDTGPAGELSQAMVITMTAYADDGAGAQMWTVTGLLSSLNNVNHIIGPLNPGETILVVFDWSIPVGTGNIIMSDSVEFDIEFSLDQAIGTQPDMSLTGITQPPTAIICDTVPITVDVLNSGDQTGNVTVTLDISGEIQTKSVTVDGGATVTVTFEWHADAAGLKTVVASIPDDGGEVPHELDCPGGIEVFAPPEFEGEWESALPLEVYVCDTLLVGAILHNIGDVSATVDVTLTIEVDGVEKHTETVAGITLDSCVPVVVMFAPWHVIDPVTMTGSLVVDVDGAPVLTGTIDIIDLEPVVTEISPATCTSLTPPGAATISARVTDDGGVAMVAYMIDVPDPMSAVPMVLVSGTPLDGTYEGVAPWDYSAAALGDHDIYVGAFDGAGNAGLGMETVHVDKAVFVPSNLTADPSPAIECETVTISIDVHNSGNITGTITVTVTLDGITVINQTVTLDPCQTVTLTGTWHADIGTWTVQGMGLQTTLVVNPAQVQPSTTTVYDANYNSGTYTNQCELTTHLVAVGVNPIPDLVPFCTEVPIPPGPAVQVNMTFNPPVDRTTAGMTVLAIGGAAFASEANGLSLYVYVLSQMGGQSTEVEMSYGEYTLLSGSHMGQPYEVGCSWSYTSYTDICLMGAMCLGMTPTPGNVVTVVSDGQTDPSGNYSDCIRIETDNPAPGIKIDWYSVGTGCIVYTEDDQSYDGMETWELISYTPVY